MKHCPVCHAPVPPDAPAGFCPVCEFRGALFPIHERQETRLEEEERSARANLAAMKEIRFFADFELLHEIGHGGMGVVFKARQLSLNRIVALKMISAGPFASRAFVERFKTEAEAAARLGHPNIVPIYEMGQENGFYYFTMKYVEGLSLSEELARRKEQENSVSVQSGEGLRSSEEFYSLRDAARLMSKIARAVHYAHQRGILHRDLKPANVLLDSAGEPHVADFGLAKFIETDAKLTLGDAVLGTANYMPPEQAAPGTREVTTSADVYSLGAILYELLAGVPPFQAETALETMRKVVEEEPLSPGRIRSALPPGANCARLDRDLETICLRCLEKEPARRYGSAEALAEDLERWLRYEPILARPASTITRARKWVRRRPVVAGLVGTVAILLTAILTGLVLGAVRIAALNAEARRSLYIANMNLAQADWDAGNVGRLISLLEGTRDSPDRGFEWHFWNRRSHQERFSMRAHETRARSVAFSNDGQLLVTAGDDSVKTWRLTETGFAMTLAGFTNEIWRAVYSPDARYVGTSGETRRPEVWEAHTGRRLFSLREYDAAIRYGLALAFSPDGKQFVWGTREGELEISSLPDGHTAGILPAQGTLAQVADWSSTGQLAVGYRDGTTRIWTVNPDPRSIVLKGHDSYITAVRFSPDGKVLATGSNDNTAKLWDAATGRPLFTFRGHVSWVSGLDFSPAGDRLATVGDQMPKVWNVVTGEELFSLRGHLQPVLSVRFAPDGQSIATASLDGTVRSWDSNPRPDPITLSEFEFGTRNLVFMPDSRHVCFATEQMTVRVIDAISGETIAELPAHDQRIRAVEVSADGHRIISLTDDGTIRIWNTLTRDLLKRIETAHRSSGELVEIPKFAYSKASGIFAFGIGDKVRMYSEKDGQEIEAANGKGSPVSAVSFSNDGRLLAIAHENKSIRVWNVIRRIDQQHIRSEAGTEPKIGISAVVFSPDGKRVISCGGEGAEVWDISTGLRVMNLQGHRTWVMNAAFSENGRRVVTGGADGTARVWETATGRELLRFNHGKLVFAVRFSPDGNRIVTGASGPGLRRERSVKVWEARP